MSEMAAAAIGGTPAFAALAPVQAGRAAQRRGRALRTIAHDTLLEALRGRWLWLALIAALVVACCALFARALALTETREVGLAIAAPLARLIAVVIVVLTTVASVVRERGERTLLLALAAPVSRASWLLGKAAGFAAIAVLTALILALPVMFLAAPSAAAAWTLSLALELVLVATVTLAIASVLGQIAPAAGAALAFYVLARLLHIVLLLGARAQDYSDLQALAPLVRVVGAVVPRLDLFTRTDWLLGGPPTASALGVVAVQATLYVALALAAAVIDLRRAPLA
jgi:hypothetical protein